MDNRKRLLYLLFCILFCGRNRKKGEEPRKECWQHTEKSGSTVLLNQTLALKPKKLKRGGAYRCCGRGRENMRGDKEIDGEGGEQSVLLV